MRCTPRRTVRAPRAGFTLIEMMAVILIIGVLAALILPAIMSGRKSAQVAAVTSEIRQLEAAIAQFRNTYGSEPPSSVILYEPGGGVWDAVSMAKIHRLWPNFDFTQAHDFDGDGAFTNSFTLLGPECLVFFLGGMPMNVNGTVTVTGFSKNPANPFYVNTTENRDGPFYEFKPSRLRPTSNALAMPNPAATFQMLVYLDPLPSQTAPFIYASSYEGQGYVPAEFSNGAQSMSSAYLVGNTGQAQKPKSFQIISPGFDNQYSLGGPYDPNQSNGLLTNNSDFDNITNFSSGQLVPNK